MPKEVHDCVEALKAKGDDEDTAYAKCVAAYKKKHGHAPKMSETQTTVMLEEDEQFKGHGPTLVGVAVTNRPFVKRLPTIALREKDGKQEMVVPIFRKAVFKHSSGVLKFDDDFYGFITKNFDADVYGQKICIDARHNPDAPGALGWITGLEQQKGGLLCAIAEPTPYGVQVINDKLYRYASAEFYRDYSASEIQLSTDELEEYDPTQAGDELAEIAKELTLTQEVRMGEEKKEVKNEQPETQTPPANDERVVALEEKLVSLQTKIDDLTAMNEKLEELNTRVSNRAFEAEVDSIIVKAEAYRDSDGNAHSPVLLGAARKMLLGEPLTEGAVALEADGANLREYMKAAVVYLLGSLPGTVPTTQKLEEEKGEESKMKKSLDAPSDETAKKFWDREDIV